MAVGGGRVRGDKGETSIQRGHTGENAVTSQAMDNRMALSYQIG